MSVSCGSSEFRPSITSGLLSKYLRRYYMASRGRGRYAFSSSVTELCLQACSKPLDAVSRLSYCGNVLWTLGWMHSERVVDEGNMMYPRSKRHLLFFFITHVLSAPPRRPASADGRGESKTWHNNSRCILLMQGRCIYILDEHIRNAT